MNTNLSMSMSEVIMEMQNMSGTVMAFHLRSHMGSRLMI